MKLKMNTKMTSAALVLASWISMASSNSISVDQFEGVDSRGRPCTLDFISKGSWRGEFKLLLSSQFSDAVFLNFPNYSGVRIKEMLIGETQSIIQTSLKVKVTVGEDGMPQVMSYSDSRGWQLTSIKNICKNLVRRL